MKFYLLASLLILAKFSFSQSSTVLVSDDNSYRIFLPADWIKQDELGTGVQFSLTAPEQNSKDFKPTFQLETGTLQNGFQNAGIEDISKQELEITKKQAGEKLIVVRDSFVVINNKKWWTGILSIPVTRKETMNYLVLKTIHNKITYTLSFSGLSDFFIKNLDQMYAYMNTMMFYTSDLTIYQNESKTNEQQLNSQLSTFTGTYFQQHPNASTKVIIAQLANGNYEAKEIREITRDGKPFVFEAILKPESITADNIILNSDAVMKADLPIMWTKATYNLNKTGSSLAGEFSSKNDAFKAYDVNLQMQGQPVLPEKTTTTINTANTEKTHQNEDEIDFEKEAEYINKYGDGKVRRLSEHQIEITLTTGKKIVLKDPYDAKNKYYESLGFFIGYTDEWNSFILAQEDGWIKFVNRTTGDVSDDIRLADVEQKETVIQSYSQVHLYKKWSPDGKWLAIERSLEDAEDETMEFVVYAVQPTFKKKYENQFEVLSFPNSNVKTQHWEPGELTWLDNNTLEIKKIKRVGGFDKEKIIGTTWLILQNGKWVFDYTKPVVKKESNITAVPTATDLENATPDSSENPALVPSITDRIFTGGKTMDELGQKLLLALKNNDKKLWYSCVYEGTYEEVSNRFEKLREEYEEKGIASWNLVKYVRTIFKKGPYCKECAYQDIKVEFEYKNPLVGFYQNLGGIILYKEKYLLRAARNGDTHVYRPN